MMNLITDWVIQIVLLIMIGTILEILIPNNTLKKYVHIVFGLLLLLMLAKPILTLFSIDMLSYIGDVESKFEISEQDQLGTEKLLENQKKEIQAEQAAYIWNEIQIQMIKDANPILQKEYDVAITSITFESSSKTAFNLDQVDTFNIFITEKWNKRELEKHTVIQPIVIETDMGQEESPNQKPPLRRIEHTLAETWELPHKKMKIYWEGGSS